MPEALNEIVVLRPTTVRRAADQMLAPRSGTLNGRVVALLDNVKANADRLLDRVELRLRERYEPAEVLRFAKSSASGPMDRHLLPEEYEKLLNADVVITALGD